MNSVTDYYTEQAKSGLGGFRGSRYQRGGGIFDWIFRKGLPVLKFLGNQALSSGLGIASDLMEGDNFKESAKKHLKQGGKNTLTYMADKMKGSGRQRRCIRKKTIKRKCVKRKTCKRKRKVKRATRDRYSWL